MTSDRDLLIRARAAIAETFTRGGHVAIRNERERTGYCSHRRHSPLCIRQRELFLDLDEAIGDEANPVSVEQPSRQPDLFEAWGEEGVAG